MFFIYFQYNLFVSKLNPQMFYNLFWSTSSLSNNNASRVLQFIDNEFNQHQTPVFRKLFQIVCRYSK